MPPSPKVEAFVKQNNVADPIPASSGTAPGTIFNFSSPLAVDMSQCSIHQEKTESDNYLVNNHKGKKMNLKFYNSFNSLIIPLS